MDDPVRRLEEMRQRLPGFYGSPGRDRDSGSHGLYHIQVLDRGPGIPQDARQRIFDPFFTTKSGGTGLGLPIVRRLMDAQGGSVSLSARQSGGTVAELVLPLKPV
jgi:two-component system NtrC family sensor kinase